MASDDEEEMAALRARKGYVRPFGDINTSKQPAAVQESEPSAATSSTKEDGDTELDEDFLKTLPSNFGGVSAHSAAHAKKVEEEAIAASGYNEELGDDTLTGFTDERFPFARKLYFGEHRQACTTLSLEDTAVRLVTGSFDYSAKLFEFNNMNASMKPFRTIEPSDGYQVISLRHTCDNLNFVCATTSARAKLFDRDGTEVLECKKGDQFLFDMHKTRGHVSPLRHVEPHPSDAEQFLTCGQDSTVRLWDVKTAEKSQKSVIVHKDKRGAKVGACYAIYVDKAGKTLVSGSDDGQISTWDTRGPMKRPRLKVNAHTAGDDLTITCLHLCRDGHTLLSRSGTDDTMKVWDVRKLRTPLKVFDALPCAYAMTQCAQSPCGKFFYTGTGLRSQDERARGTLELFDAEALHATGSIALIQQGSVIGAQWSARIDQMFVSLSDGTVCALYDDQRSHKGVLMALARSANRKKKQDVFVSDRLVPILAPNDAAGRSGLVNRKRKFEKERRSTATRAPQISKELLNAEKPEQGLKMSSLSAAVIESGMGVKRFKREDPREALVKYDEVARKNRIFTKAYEETQPQTMFRDDHEHADSDEKQ